MHPSHPNPFAPSDRMLRQFAGLWILFFGALAGWKALHHDPRWAMILSGLAVTLGPLGLAWPRAIKPVFIGWMALAWPIGWLVSRVILGILFYGMFTPIAALFRLAGRDTLRLRPQPQAATYWLPKPQAAGKEQYLRPF